MGKQFRPGTWVTPESRVERGRSAGGASNASSRLLERVGRRPTVHDPIESAFLILAVHGKQCSLDITGIDLQRPGEGADDQEEAVPVVEGKAYAVRLLCHRPKLVENLPDPNVDDSVTAWVKKRQDRRRH